MVEVPQGTPGARSSQLDLVRPDAHPGPTRGVDTSGAFRAIGELGQAWQHLSSTLIGAGKEWNEVALQQAQISAHTNASQISYDHMGQSSQQFNDFRTNNEGLNAGDNLPKFFDQLDKGRADAISQARSPMEKQYVTQEINERTSRYKFYAAEYASQQAKSAGDKISTARIAMTDPEVAANPADNGVFNKAVEDKAGAVVADAVRKGLMTPDQDLVKKQTNAGIPPTRAVVAALPEAQKPLADNLIRQNIGQLWSTRINKLIELGQPWMARSLFEQNKDRADYGGIHEDAKLDLEKRIVAAERTIGANQIGESIISGQPMEIRGGSSHQANFMHGQYGAPGANLSKVETEAGNITVNQASAPYFKGFINDLKSAGAPVNEVGSYNDRTIAGSSRLSQHAYGNAIDIDQEGRNESPKLLKWVNEHGSQFREILEKYNMISGGDWKNPDFGHFEWAGDATVARRFMPEVSGPLDFSKTQEQLGERLKAATKMAENLKPGDEPLRLSAEKATEAAYNREKRVFTDKISATSQKLYEGLGAKASEDFNAMVKDKDMRANFTQLEAMDPKAAVQFRDYLETHSRAERREMSEGEREQYYELKGMSHDNRAEFDKVDLAHDPRTKGLPQSQFDELVKIQKAPANPIEKIESTGHMARIRSVLEYAVDAHLGKRDPENARTSKQRDQFYGQMIDSISGLEKATGKKLTDQEILSLGQKMLLQVARPQESRTPGNLFGIFGRGKESQMEFEARQGIIDDFRKKYHGANPSEQQIREGLHYKGWTEEIE